MGLLAMRARYGLAAILRNALPLLLLLALAPLLADRWWWAPWLLCPAIGLFLYRLTIVMHDCTHATLFAGRRANLWVGALLGAVTGVDFLSFTKQHWRHHRNFGTPQDPQGFHYVGLQDLSPRAYLWHLAKPLFGANLRYALPESVVAPSNLARLIRSGGLLLVLGVQAVLLAIVTGLGRHPVLALLPLLAAATFSLFFSQLRGIAEHAVIGDVAPAGHVRTHAPHWLDAVLLYELHFNYHAEHHARPQVPSQQLEAHHRSQTDGQAARQASMFQTLRDIHRGLGRVRG